jgi:catechol 2,3-dioxygenase-like lactoylglutathione lyase family enzyme
MQPQITHLCLHVESLKECVRFYQRYCQMEVIEDRSDAGEGSVYMAAVGQPNTLVFQMMSGGKNLQLAASDEQHFGFNVESKAKVDEIAQQARQDGALVWEPAEYVPGAYLCTVRDPNGNHVEFSFGHPMPPQ